jgi:hypothetical protein
MDTKNIYDDITKIYSTALKEAESKIGFDAHEKTMLKVSIDTKVINASLEKMYNTGTDYARKIMLGNDQAKKDNLEAYIQTLDKAKPTYEKFSDQDLVPLKDAENLKGAHAGKILDKLHNSFDYGLKLVYVIAKVKQDRYK